MTSLVFMSEVERMNPENRGLLRIEAKTGPALLRRAINFVAPSLESLLGLGGINALYDRAKAMDPSVDFMSRVLAAHAVTVEVRPEELVRIPQKGAFVAVANHPFGMLEGMILGSLLNRVRPDFKLLGTFFLKYIPDLHEKIIFVDNFGSKDAFRKNVGPLKECLRHLRDGSPLAVFPAGGVARFDPSKRRVTDQPWNPTTARIIRKTECPVLPIFFQGANGPLFHLLGMLHPRLRTAMLPRELLKKEGGTFKATIGKPIPFHKLAKLKRDDELIAYLRLRTYMLKKRSEEPKPSMFRRLPVVRTMHRVEVKPPKQVFDGPIAEAAPTATLAAEIAGLSEKNLMLESGKFKVYCAKAKHIPHMLREIGRLREFTFRLVGEGTGKPLDLDRFDDHYEHLFIWNAEVNEVVGAYRIGRTDKITAERGVDGLYTSTLFSFKSSLFERMGPALEMGRSFVRPEYQKSFSPLLLLWKGICHYILAKPDYKMLFGPVSISNDYSAASREMIVRYLNSRNSLSELSKLVKAKTPPRLKSMKRHEIREFYSVMTSMEDVAEVIGDVEKSINGIPVLLRQYLKLGGKVLSFNVDPDFNNCLDGLILVDLTQASPKLLANYMGKDNVFNFLDYHAVKEI